MAKTISPEVQRLIEQWSILRGSAGRLDFEVASWAADVLKFYPNEKDFCQFHRDALDIRANVTAAKHRRMAAALTIAPDAEVWSAVGWAGVLQIVRVQSVQKAKKVCAAVKRHRAEHKANLVTGRALQSILEGAAPEVFVPRAPQQETKKDREQEKRAQTKATMPSADRGAVKAATDRAERLATFIRGLVEKGHAYLVDLMDEQTRADAGLPKRKRKGAA